MHNFQLTFDEQYEFVKLYDLLRDMDFELTPNQTSVFEKVLDSEFTDSTFIDINNNGGMY